MQKLTTPMIRGALLTASSITIASAFSIQMVVFCAFLIPIILAERKFNFVRVTTTIVGILGSLALGTLVAEMFADHPLMILGIAAAYFYILLTRSNTPATLSSVLFFFCYAAINASYGSAVEFTLLSSIKASLITLPLGWLCYFLFPSVPSTKVRPTPPPSTLNRIEATFIIILTLGLFLYFDIGKALFCLSVVINTVLRDTSAQRRMVLRSIIPIQVSGALVALVLHTLVLGHGANVIWLAAILFFASLVIFYFIYGENTQYLSIPNFESSILVAILIPFTLYTTVDGFAIEPFIRRAANMVGTAAILSVFLLFLPSLKAGKKSKSTQIASE